MQAISLLDFCGESTDLQKYQDTKLLFLISDQLIQPSFFQSRSSKQVSTFFMEVL